MTASIHNVPIPRRTWVLGIVGALVLGGCATLPEEDPNAVDIGYGEVDRSHVNGSVESAAPVDESLIQINTLADMLRGLPGVQASVRGDDVIVRIRGGGTSFLLDTQPLVVLDGMEYRGSLGAINPAHIKSLRVLKNAGETAVFGSRGANGVILIQTKTGGGET